MFLPRCFCTKSLVNSYIVLLRKFKWPKPNTSQYVLYVLSIYIRILSWASESNNVALRNIELSSLITENCRNGSLVRVERYTTIVLGRWGKEGAVKGERHVPTRDRMTFLMRNWGIRTVALSNEILIAQHSYSIDLTSDQINQYLAKGKWNACTMYSRGSSKMLLVVKQRKDCERSIDVTW